MTPELLTRHTRGPDTRATGCVCSVITNDRNPTCNTHGWWTRDPTVLQLADHPNGPWAAALATYGDRS